MHYFIIKTFSRITNTVKYSFYISTVRKHLTWYRHCDATQAYLSLEIVIMSLPGHNSSV